MARGGFHGGGFHSGGHHSGGFHGGGSRGGGFHGGGFHGGGSRGGGFHGRGGFGHYDGGGGPFGDDFYTNEAGAVLFYFAIAGIAGFIAFVLLFLKMIADNEVPGLNFVNFGIFCASFVLHIFALRHYERTSDLKDFKGADLDRVGGRVWKSNGYRPTHTKGNKRTWVSELNDRYCISFFDREFGGANARKVYEAMQRSPKIVWMSSFRWLVFSVICFGVNFFFYEMVIPVFENMIMTDFAFAFIDETVFYFMSVLSLLMGIANLVIIKVRDSILHECAKRIVEDNKAFEEIEEKRNFIASTLSGKWYYNICPNCGAEASRALRSCTSCGSSLEVLSFTDGMASSVHQISVSATKKEEGKADEK